MRYLLLLTLGIVAASAQEKVPVKWKLAAPARVAPGAKFEATLTASIDEGWHLYSLKELEGGPIPTRISLPEGQPFQIAGDIGAPPPLRNQDETFGMEVESYERSAEFLIPAAAATDASGSKVLTIAVRFQVCDDKLCLPPRTVRTEAPVELKK